VIVLLPLARLLALTGRVAVDPDSVADPRVLLPNEKVTVPVAAALPEVGFTVAVSTVLAVEEIDAGLAETVVVVGAETVTVTEPLEFT